MMKRLLFISAFAALASGCTNLKGGDPVVTTTGKVPIPTVTKKTVTLLWTPAGGTIQGYKVEASLDNANFVELGTVSGDADGVNIDVPTGATYYFRIRSFNQGGNSGYTTVASISI